MKFGIKVGLGSLSRYAEGNLDRMTAAKFFSGPPAKFGQKPIYALKSTLKKNGLNDFP
jgi:hypothetical protein